MQAETLIAAIRPVLAGRRELELAPLSGCRAEGRERTASEADVAVLGRDLAPPQSRSRARAGGAPSVVGDRVAGRGGS